MDTDGGRTAYELEPTLADGLSLEDSGEITFTTTPGDRVSVWCNATGHLCIDFDSADGTARFTDGDAALLKAAVDHVHVAGSWNPYCGERYRVVAR